LVGAYVIPLASQGEFYDAIERSGCVREGHLIFHDLHHEFYLNPSKVFSSENDDIRQLLVNRLKQAIGQNIDFILVPENSEAKDFAPLLADYLTPSLEPIVLPYRKKDLGSHAATPYVIDDALRNQLSGKSVLFADSGTITGESVLSVRDGLIRADCDSIHIFTLFHRKDDEWAENLIGLSKLGILVKYYYFGRLFLPVWRSRDCLWEVETEYWRSRSQKLHSKQAQLRIRRQLLTLQPLLTSSINWKINAPTSDLWDASGEQLNLPSMPVVPAILRPETFLKFRLNNEYHATRSLERTIEKLHSKTSRSLAGAIAIVSVATRHLLAHQRKADFNSKTSQRILSACEHVIYNIRTTQRDKWNALRIIKYLSERRFINGLPDLIKQAQLDDSLFLGLDDSIHSLLEDNPSVSEQVRDAFNLARYLLDREFSGAKPGSVEYKEYRTRALIHYDLRQDQNPLLPMGRTEYPLQEVLFPLQQYIPRSKPLHTPLAKTIDNILRTLRDTEVASMEKEGASVNIGRYLPLRLQKYIVDWKDDVYKPLLNIHSLLERLLERPFLERPDYLINDTPPNMLADIEQADATVSRILDSNVVQPSSETLADLSKDLTKLKEFLTRLFHDIFDEGGSVNQLVQEWFINLETEIKRCITQYMDELDSRGISLNIQYNSKSMIALCYRDHLQHALNNFLMDTMKDDAGAFPQNHQGEKQVSIEVNEILQEFKIQIVCEDTGVGITDEAIQTIDNPSSEGTLSTIKRRLRRIGGDLRAERRPNGGTRFTLELLAGGEF
jgi:hypothetical protein